jgi:glyoxylase-like metal-dependent hydrolase (beta-lactamase superfamily II)/rhodanese-related sulfurtransferase
MKAKDSAFVLKQLNPGACRTYLVGSESTKDAALIDPVLDHVGTYLKLLEEEGWTLRYAIDTHTHADHLSGGTALARQAGAEYAMHKRSGVRTLGRRLSDGSSLRVGGLTLEFIETPGHTKDSLTVNLPGMLLTGDWLFIGGAGRTDLPGGDPAEHWESLQRIVPGLKDTDVVYPAHDYRNLTESTVGVERSTNPNLAPRSKESYVKWMGSMSQPTPEWMVKTVRANLEGTTNPAVDWIPADAACMSMCSPVVSGLSLESIPEVSVEEVYSRQRASDGPLLLDVREPDEYTGPLGHLPGTLLIPLGELRDRLTEMDSHRGRPIVTVCRSGNRSLYAAAILLEAGFADVSSMAGGTEAWHQNGYPIER